jgi:hypothetical protein
LKINKVVKQISTSISAPVETRDGFFMNELSLMCPAPSQPEESENINELFTQSCLAAQGTHSTRMQFSIFRLPNIIYVHAPESSPLCSASKLFS